MKSPQKITRIRLDVNDQDKPALFGVVTHDPDYRLSLKLNGRLDLSLKADQPVRVPESGGKELNFSKFTDSREAPDLVFSLISNRSGNSFLLKSLKNIDYIFMILDLGKSFNAEHTASSIREIDTVTAVFNLEFKSLKDKNLKYIL